MPPRSGLERSDFVHWPIATDDALTANRRFRGIADMDRFSSRKDVERMTLNGRTWLRTSAVQIVR